MGLGFRGHVERPNYDLDKSFAAHVYTLLTQSGSDWTAVKELVLNHYHKEPDFLQYTNDIVISA